MSIKFDLEQIISQVGRDKGIDKTILIEALESAVLSAAKKHFGHNRNLEASFNEEIGEIEVLEFKTVVENVEDPDTQMTMSEAQADYDADCEMGDELGRKLGEYRDRKGELVNGIVQRFERGSLIVNLGRTDAVLPEREQISRERYRQNDRVRAMILDIDPVGRGPQVVLTRSHPEFMKKLFELEVPEISEGIVEIKSVAREPGERAKIAVYSNDPNVDPVGACVGIKGSRVQAVVGELRGERIDIVTFTSDAPSFVARALAPAEVLRVVVDEDDHAMEVVVADDQLSLAIGRRGQNVKLASKLSGWRIDVRSESVAEEESKRAHSALESIPDIGFGETELLYQEGYRSIREITSASVEELGSIEGLDDDRAEVIMKGALEVLTQLEAGEGESEDDDTLTDIHQLVLPEEVRGKVIDSGFVSIQALAVVDSKELGERAGIADNDAELVCKAVEAFLRVQKPELPGFGE